MLLLCYFFLCWDSQTSMSKQPVKFTTYWLNLHSFLKLHINFSNTHKCFYVCAHVTNVYSRRTRQEVIHFSSVKENRLHRKKSMMSFKLRLVCGLEKNCRRWFTCPLVFLSFYSSRENWQSSFPETPGATFMQDAVPLVSNVSTSLNIVLYFFLLLLTCNNSLQFSFIFIAPAKCFTLECGEVEKNNSPKPPGEPGSGWVATCFDWFGVSGGKKVVL